MHGRYVTSCDFTFKQNASFKRCAESLEDAVAYFELPLRGKWARICYSRAFCGYGNLASNVRSDVYGVRVTER
jgi:hypothetical protein